MAHFGKSYMRITLVYELYVCIVYWLLLSLKVWRIIWKFPTCQEGSRGGQSHAVQDLLLLHSPQPIWIGFWAFSKNWDENSLVECLAVLSRPVFSRQYFWGKINNVLGQVVRGICEVVQAMSEMFCFQSGFLTTWHEILVVLMYMEYSGFKRVIWEKVVLVLWPTQKNCSKAVWS